jgi:hypothetical protein
VGEGGPVTITPRELIEEMLRLSRELDGAQADLVAAVREEAQAEQRYRRARATAYLATSGTVAEREAYVGKTIDEEAFAAQLAEGLAKAALESVRNRRAQLSALQSVAASVREELQLARMDPGA